MDEGVPRGGVHRETIPRKHQLSCALVSSGDFVIKPDMESRGAEFDIHTRLCGTGQVWGVSPTGSNTHHRFARFAVASCGLSSALPATSGRRTILVLPRHTLQAKF